MKECRLLPWTAPAEVARLQALLPSFEAVEATGALERHIEGAYPNANHEPLIVVESECSESWPHLRADKDIWLYGSTTVNLSKSPQRVLLLRGRYRPSQGK